MVDESLRVGVECGFDLSGHRGDPLVTVPAVVSKVTDQFTHGAAMLVSSVAHLGELVELATGAEPSHGGGSLRVDFGEEGTELVHCPGLCLNEAASVVDQYPHGFGVVVIDPAVSLTRSDETGYCGGVSLVGFAGTVTVTHGGGESGWDLVDFDTGVGECGSDVTSVPGCGFNTGLGSAVCGGEVGCLVPTGGCVGEVGADDCAPEVVDDRSVECVKMGIDTDHNHDLSSQIVVLVVWE